MSQLPTKPQFLALYRNMLRECYRFPDYNFRNYFLRITKEDFHGLKDVKEPAKINQFYTEAQEKFQMLKRQSIISKMYTNKTHVLDKQSKKE